MLTTLSNLQPSLLIRTSHNLCIPSCPVPPDAVKSGYLICPGRRFREGVLTTLTFLVNKTLVRDPHHCTVHTRGTYAHFHFKPPGGGAAAGGIGADDDDDYDPSVLCQTPYHQCTEEFTASLACPSCTCGCQGQSQGAVTFRLELRPTLGHSGGIFSADVACVHGHQTALTRQTTSSCGRVIVGEWIGGAGRVGG